MEGQVKTTYVSAFLAEKGYTRVNSVPFSWCLYSHNASHSNITLDEEESTQDIAFLGDDWVHSGARALFDELVAELTKRQSELVANGTLIPTAS